MKESAGSRPAPLPLTKHRMRRRLRGTAALIALLSVISARASAQVITPAVDVTTGLANPACDYATCAMGIAPRWNGLALVRGAAGQQVANLSFFWPRDISGALGPVGDRVANTDSAEVSIRRAVRLRRIGAAFTDGGLVLAGAAAVRALHTGSVRRADGVVAAAGLAALGLSVPIQFAADGALSRAVWWHNLRFAR